MLIAKAGRLTQGYRNFDNYRLRILLAASGTRTRTRAVRTVAPARLKSEATKGKEATHFGPRRAHGRERNIDAHATVLRPTRTPP
jgi:hypothetical protein